MTKKRPDTRTSLKVLDFQETSSCEDPSLLKSLFFNHRSIAESDASIVDAYPIVDINSATVFAGCSHAGNLNSIIAIP
jgi:hypothetical protein